MYKICIPENLRVIDFLSSFFGWTALIAFALGILSVLVSFVSPKVREAIKNHNRLSIGLAFVFPVVALVLSMYLQSQLPFVREVFTESLSLASAGKNAVSEYFARHGKLPSSNEQAELAAPGEISSYWTDSVSVGEQGVITITLVEICDSHTIVLTPSIEDR